MTAAEQIPVPQGIDEVVVLLTQLVTQIAGSPRNTQLTDTRGIGKPSNFRGDQGKFKEWMLKLNAYLRSLNPD